MAAKPTSRLAAQLEQVDTSTHEPKPHGPRNQCGPVYGPGNLEDWNAVEALRHRTSWALAQEHVDKALGVTDPLPNDYFRYHWRRKCACWPRKLRKP